MKNEYIAKINTHLPFADIELLDFVYQLLQKSVEPLTPCEEQLKSA